MTDLEPLTIDVLEPEDWTPLQAAAYVSEPWQKAVGSIVETGRRLIEAKQRVGHGRWIDTVALLPFSERTAQRLTQIAKHPDLSNTTHVSDLPASWGTLYVLSQLPPGEITRRIECGDITPELDRKQAEEMATVYQAARQETLNAWSNFVDGLTQALSQAQSFNEAPYLPDNYVDLDGVKQRYEALGRIINSWEKQ